MYMLILFFCFNEKQKTKKKSIIHICIINLMPNICKLKTCSKQITNKNYETYCKCYYRSRSYALYFCSNKCKEEFNKTGKCHSCSYAFDLLTGDDGLTYCKGCNGCFGKVSEDLLNHIPA